MIVTASGWGFVPDYEDLFFSCLRYNWFSNAANGVPSCFGHANVAASALIEDRMVPACVEVTQKLKRLQDLARVSPENGISVQSRVLLFGTYVTSLHAEEMATGYPSVHGYTSRYSGGLARRKILSLTKTVVVPVASSSQPLAQEDVVIGDPENHSGCNGELQRSKRKKKIVNFTIGDCETAET